MLTNRATRGKKLFAHPLTGIKEKAVSWIEKFIQNRSVLRKIPCQSRTVVYVDISKLESPKPCTADRAIRQIEFQIRCKLVFQFYCTVNHFKWFHNTSTGINNSNLGFRITSIDSNTQLPCFLFPSRGFTPMSFPTVKYLHAMKICIFEDFAAWVLLRIPHMTTRIHKNASSPFLNKIYTWLFYPSHITT